MAAEPSVVTDAELVERLPRVRIDHDNRHFYRGWLQRQLLINRCNSCQQWHHPPKPVCPHCWSRDLRPTEVSGRGTIHLLMLLHQGPPAPGVDYSTGPHPVATVELAEQSALRLTSTVVGCATDDIAIGMPVELTWIERDGVPFPAFRPQSLPTPGAGA
ncbi:MAG TPA: zinc ribbon domain-containing protein [Acidimicrobiales bacterium]|nr:zinc ribbon domain-containing protein [Acidimicrobiales bacterium]